ncbi:MAG: hypothetical protein NTU46_10345 [Burkholderiales bacterium]|nr:hypothetical protein [Burkholderiales bacterium]
MRTLLHAMKQSRKPMKRANPILISEEDLSSIQETLYLLAIPNMRESIKESMAEPLSKGKDCPYFKNVGSL